MSPSSTTVSLRHVPQLKSQGTRVITTVVKKVNTPSTPSRARLRRRNRRASPPSNTPSGRGDSRATQAYINCLNDPFNESPIRVGFGTLVPTELATIYWHGTLTSGSDGSLTVMAFPSSRGTIFVQNGPFGTATPLISKNFYDASNTLFAQREIGRARVLAGGLRLFPLVAQTSAQGVAGSALMPSPIYSDENYLNGNNQYYFNLPQLQYSMAGQDPLQVLWRPEDLSDFEFNQNINYNVPNNLNIGPVMMIVITGLPAATPVFGEFVLHVEYLNNAWTNAGSLGSEPFPSRDNTPASDFTSLESLANRVLHMLKPPASTVNKFAMGSATALNVARNLYGLYHARNIKSLSMSGPEPPPTPPVVTQGSSSRSVQDPETPKTLELSPEQSFHSLPSMSRSSTPYDPPRLSVLSGSASSTRPSSSSHAPASASPHRRADLEYPSH